MVYGSGMLALTKNEARLLSFLLRNFTKRYSINSLARELGLSPMGARKIAMKLEKANILKSEAISNAIYYHPDLGEEIGRKTAELVLSYKELNPYARVQAKDLEQLRPYALCAVLFGSVLTKAENAGDIDVLLVLEDSQFRNVHKVLLEIQSIKPKKISEMLQSREDLVRNINKRDAPLLSAIRTGQILWGSEIIVEGIRSDTSSK
jgi:DNA-binding Lrp family transcriptional regulator